MDMLTGVQRQIDVGNINYANWQTLWNDRNSLIALSKAKGWRVIDLSSNYITYVKSEIIALDSTFIKYDVDGKLKLQCSYSQWDALRSSLFNLKNNFSNVLIPLINAKNIEYFGELIDEDQQQAESWDNQEIFEEQVEHYYLKYATLILEEVEKRGIQFNFLTLPPLKPSWTNTKDGSNAKKVNLFTNQMSSWWSIEGKRFSEALEEYDLKNTPTPTPSNSLIPTQVIIDAPTQVSLNSEGKASIQVVAYVQPVDLTKLPPGRSSLDVDLIFKGSGGSGCSEWPIESISTQKTGYKFFILNYSLTASGSCTGTFQFYGDSLYEKANYPTFTFNVLPYVDVNAISISDVSLSSQALYPGDIATIYYVIRNAGSKATNGVGAGIGDFGVETGPFGDDYPSIGWTLGLVKGDSSYGVYKSNISIPVTANPGVYKTWVFWKGVTGPISGPNLTIFATKTDQNDLLKSFTSWVQEAQAAFSDRVIQAVWAKFGDGGGYQYIKLRPEPAAEYLANPSIENFGLYKATLAAWADYEIINLRIENYIKPEADSSKSDLQKFCLTQSASTSLSLKDSDIQLSNIRLRIDRIQTLSQTNKQAEYNFLMSELKSIGVNLKTWTEKLPVYQSRDKDCSDFSNLLNYAKSLFDNMNSLLNNLNLAMDSTRYATYIKLSFVGDNQNLSGKELFLGAIDSTGDGRGSIQVNAFLRTYETKLMYSNTSLNTGIIATSQTPNICRISPPKYSLGTSNPMTWFYLTPLSEGKCLLNFVGNIENRSDLISTNITWLAEVRTGSVFQDGNAPTPTTSPSPTPTTSPSQTPATVEYDGIEEDFYANLSVSKRSDGKYKISFISNIEEDQVIIKATKKRSKSIVYKVQTSEFGGASILTSRKLTGYKLTLTFEGERLARVKAK